MAHSSAIRRKLYMHSAHRTVGVSGGGIAAGPYCCDERFSADDLMPVPKRVVLAAHTLDPNARAVLAVLQRAIEDQCAVQCHTVKLDAFDIEPKDLADADCVVALGQGLHVVRHWSDLAPDQLVANDPTDGSDEPMEVEIVAGAQWHPVLEDVGPFTARQSAGQRPNIPPDATTVLTGRTAGGVWPVAWTTHPRRNRAFHTTLGSVADACHPDFIRLVLNAVAWVGSLG